MTRAERAGLGFECVCFVSECIWFSILLFFAWLLFVIFVFYFYFARAVCPRVERVHVT